MDFLSSLNFWDYLILALVIVAVTLAIYSMRSRKKKGKGGEKQAADGPVAELKQLEALEKREGKSKLDNN